MAVHRHLLEADIRARWRSFPLFTVLVTGGVTSVERVLREVHR